MRKFTTGPRPVKVRNAACVRCGGPVTFDPVRWLACARNCRRAVSHPIPFAVAGGKGRA